jgi:hypothetical protein
MSEEIKCPVCGKVGIPDYLSEDTTCPCCGTDLSIFRVIDQIPQVAPRKRSLLSSVAIVAVLVAMVMGGILWSQRSVVPLEDKISGLEDSIASLNTELANLQRPLPPLNGFKYVIRKGDSFWAVSNRFYGTGTKCKELAEANGLAVDSKLNVGDTIIIK